MTEQKIASGLDFGTLRKAIEERDAGTLVGLYAEDAELYTVNRNAPPSSPRVLRGRAMISEHLNDVCGREMTHRVEDEVVGRDRVAFTERCEYPDGTGVMGAQTLEVRDGRISRQLSVEVWDE